MARGPKKPEKDWGGGPADRPFTSPSRQGLSRTRASFLGRPVSLPRPRPFGGWPPPKSHPRQQASAGSTARHGDRVLCWQAFAARRGAPISVTFIDDAARARLCRGPSAISTELLTILSRPKAAAVVVAHSASVPPRCACTGLSSWPGNVGEIRVHAPLRIITRTNSTSAKLLARSARDHAMPWRCGQHAARADGRLGGPGLRCPSCRSRGHTQPEAVRGRFSPA